MDRSALALALALAAAVAGAPACAADPPGVPSAGELRLRAPGLGEAPGAGPRPWRAVAEEGICLGVGMLGYAVTRPAANGARPVPVIDKLRLAHGAWGFDADGVALNYVGHPLDGLLFYQLARGNRLGIGTSLGLTLATAWAWELAEYQELLSVHDVVSTTAGGFAMGEAFGQLAAWFGQRPGGGSRFASVLFQLPRAIHDRLDGAPRPPPARFGVADVSAWVAGGRSGPGDAGEVRLGGRARLVRSDDVGTPGSGWRALVEANVTSVATELAFARQGIAQIEFQALASLAGFYGRDLDAAGEGHDLLATASLGFDYLRRAEPVAGGREDDFLAVVRIPGVEVVGGLRRGPVRAGIGLEAAVTMGGVQPLALLGRPTDLPGAPGVLRISGYYHGLGTLLAPRATLAVGPVELAASLRVDRLEAISRFDVAPSPSGGALLLEDERRVVKLGATWRAVPGRLRLLATWERRDRWGRAGEATATLAGSSALLGVALEP